MNKKRPPFIFIYGPTAVGKTDFAERLALAISGEIINMDSTQCYTPLNIGTAKHDWQKSPVPCHLFDCIDQPEHSSVAHYRTEALNVARTIQKKGKIPIFVGGSGFYLMSLLYPPVISGSTNSEIFQAATWHDLYAIDPIRAEQIDKNDQYRIERALSIWRTTGIKPSHYKPTFDPPNNFFLFFLTRDKEELRMRVIQRVDQMFQEGFIQEVSLLSAPWKDFLQKKKIIGYVQVLAYLNSNQDACDYEYMKKSIVSQTMAYAKRQWTFWRMLNQKINLATKAENDSNIEYDARVINLTLCKLDLYIKQLSEELLNTLI